MTGAGFGLQSDSNGRLEYLDSIRGLAALYVVWGHAVLDIDRRTLPPLGRYIYELVDHGKLGVALFIVLSGYCLMLPVVRSGSLALRGGFADYLRRRARRIYPPYLAAMVLSLGLLAFVPHNVLNRSAWVMTFLPAFDLNNIVSHLFLFHNLDNGWLYKINAPFWSVATEWQIYFLFPLVLLPIARSVGAFWTVPAGFVIGLAPIFFFRWFETAAPWFVGLFAMGMCAAMITHSARERMRKLSHRRIWGWATVSGGVVLLALLWIAHVKGFATSWKSHLLTQTACGGFVSTGLVWLATGPRRGVACRLLLFRPLRALGACSYSLYLTHAIAVGVTSICLASLAGAAPVMHRLLLSLIVGSVASVLLAAIFFRLFERPFLRQTASLPADSASPVGSMAEKVLPAPGAA